MALIGFGYQIVRYELALIRFSHALAHSGFLVRQTSGRRWFAAPRFRARIRRVHPDLRGARFQHGPTGRGALLSSVLFTTSVWISEISQRDVSGRKLNTVR